MEQKGAQFLEQFAATVFAQWQQTEEKERFWLNTTFVHNLLEEAVAKLPKIPLKGHLVRELTHAVGVLKTLLEKQYVEFQKSSASKQQKKHKSEFELLCEEDVERALATADAAKRLELAAILALDEYVDTTTNDAVASVAQVEAYVQQLQRIRARSYESPAELSRKCGLYVQRIVRCAEQLVTKWSGDRNGNWNCAPSAPCSEELQKLRAALQLVVSLDASEISSRGSILLPSPWTSFYRPSESALFQKLDYEAETAKVFGILLTLAIYFPVVMDDDDEATSDESSDADSDADEERASAKQEASSKTQQKLDFVEQAKQTVRHVVFASKKRGDASWLVAVLAFLHQLPKPKTYREDDDDDELALVAADQRALQDCLSDVYTRAFANPNVLDNYSLGQESKSNDWLLFQTIVCVRHAAHFMRAERRQSIPAVTTVMVKLVSLPLPQSFWKWLAHVKKVYSIQSPVVRDVMKKLTKNKSGKMANVLLSESEVTLEELTAITEVRRQDANWFTVYVCNVYSSSLSR